MTICTRCGKEAKPPYYGTTGEHPNEMLGPMCESCSRKQFPITKSSRLATVWTELPREGYIIYHSAEHILAQIAVNFSRIYFEIQNKKVIIEAVPKRFVTEILETGTALYAVLTDKNKLPLSSERIPVSNKDENSQVGIYLDPSCKLYEGDDLLSTSLGVEISMEHLA